MEIRKQIELRENSNTAYQYVLDVIKAMLREKFIVLNAYIRRQEK